MGPWGRPNLQSRVESSVRRRPESRASWGRFSFTLSPYPICNDLLHGCCIDVRAVRCDFHTVPNQLDYNSSSRGALRLQNLLGAESIPSLTTPSRRSRPSSWPKLHVSKSPVAIFHVVQPAGQREPGRLQSGHGADPVFPKPSRAGLICEVLCLALDPDHIPPVQARPCDPARNKPSHG